MNIIKHEFKANFIALILWTFSLIIIIFLVSFEFEIFQGNLEIQEFMDSPLFQQFYGALGAGNVNIMTPEGFLSLLSIYIYLPLAIHAGLLGAGIISKEERNKTAEYLFTLPVSRKRILAAKFIAGSEANELILITTEYAAMTFVPNVFTILISAVIPTATNVCCIPVGNPIRILFLKIVLSKTSLVNENRIIL